MNRLELERLGSAVVDYAAKDYLKARRLIDKNAGDEKLLITLRKEICELEKFFKSGWFNELVSFDGTWFLAKLKEAYEKEQKGGRVLRWSMQA